MFPYPTLDDWEAYYDRLEARGRSKEELRKVKAQNGTKTPHRDRQPTHPRREYARALRAE